MFGLKYLAELQDSVRQEFEQLVNALRGYVIVEHNDDGTHSDVTADSVASANGYHEHNRLVGMGEWVPLNVAASDLESDSGSWTFTLTNYSIRYMRVGKSITIQVTIFNNAEVTGTPEFLRIKLPRELWMKRLNASYDIEDRIYSSVGVSSQGMVYIFVGQKSTLAEDTWLVFELAPSGLWAAGTGIDIVGQLTYEAAEF